MKLNTQYIRRYEIPYREKITYFFEQESHLVSVGHRCDHQCARQ